MSLEVDLHNMTTTEAIRYLQRTIMANPKCDSITAIHGYHNGCKIKNLLSNKFNLHNRRVRYTIPDWDNEGITYILLSRGR